MTESGFLARFVTPDPTVAHVVSRLASVTVTLLTLFLVYRLIVRLIERVLARRDLGTARVRTLGALLLNVTRWVLAFIVLVIVLTELGIDVRALLVSAGLVGIAIGFGSQALIRDLISGLFLLFEGVASVGDVLDVDGRRGTVEGIGLRVTRLRQEDGSLRIVPNGQLGDFVNLSAGWARAAIEVTVGRDADVPRALAALGRVADAWARETGSALESPEAHGIMRITGGDVVLRLIVKVDPGRRAEAERELRRRIKEAFDHEGLPLVAVA